MKLLESKVKQALTKKQKELYQRCSIKKAVLKNSAIFTGKHLCWSLFLITLQTLGLQPNLYFATASER